MDIDTRIRFTGDGRTPALHDIVKGIILFLIAVSLSTCRRSNEIFRITPSLFSQEGTEKVPFGVMVV